MLMQFPKISAATLRKHVYELLREAIINGKVLPGQSISLQSLSSQFGVSLQPIREALWQLESEEIILLESNRPVRDGGILHRELGKILKDHRTNRGGTRGAFAPGARDPGN